MAFFSIWEKITIQDSMINKTCLLFSAYLIFLIQLILPMLYTVSIRAKSIILANVVAVAGTLSFYLFGFTFAFGEGGNSRGINLFSLNNITTDHDYSYDYKTFFLSQWALAVATASITTGSVPALRTRFGSHLVFSLFLTGIVYPVVAHWVWSCKGWLSPSSSELLFGSGAIDFGGSGLVHLLGGISGLLGSLIGRPRVMGQLGQSRKSSPKTGHRAMMVVLGLLLLSYGWFGFNPNWFAKIFEAYPSTTNQGTWILLSRTAKVTMVAAATAGIVSILGRRLVVGDWNEVDACIGLLGGVVAISSGCSVVEPWAAVVCGFFVACVLTGLNLLALKFQHDDPIETAQLHCGFSVWGLIFTGLFAKKELVIQAYNDTQEGGVTRPFGLLMGGGWGLLGAQVVELLVIVGFVSVTMGLLFYILHKLRTLRILDVDEITNLDDFSRHEGCAYIQSKENHVPFYGDYTPLQISIGDKKDHQHSYGLYQ